MITIGCIADDFTGASDAASYLAEGGLTVRLYSGIPHRDERPAQEDTAVVIALKSRTQEPHEAVRDVLRAAFWLKRRGAECFYFKYCATFDSTDNGNIGPCADALASFLNVPFSVLCPAAPANGRTVAGGCIYVNGVLLHESHMKDHPLTPMRASRISDLMRVQSVYPSVEWHWNDLYAEPDRIRRKISSLKRKMSQGKGKPFYIVPDCVTEVDCERIAAVFGGLKLLTGGSGILCPLAKRFSGNESVLVPEMPSSGRAVVLAGSCSDPTIRQVDCFLQAGYSGMKMDVRLLLEGKQTAEDYVEFLNESKGAVIVYSSEKADAKSRAHGADQETVAACLEEVTAKIAKQALERGFTRIIVAGGETSGAVVKKLGYKSFSIARSVAPGVPILIPAEDDRIRVVLKSGGFGQEDFFIRAVQMTGEDKKDRKI